MWKLVCPCCFGSHFHSQQGCQAFPYINCNLYVLVSCVFIFFAHFSIFVSKILIHNIFFHVRQKQRGGQHKPPLACIIRALPQASLSLWLWIHGSISLQSWMLPLQKKERGGKKKRKQEESTFPHHIILFAIREACCCCAIHVGFLFPQPKTRA